MGNEISRLQGIYEDKNNSLVLLYGRTGLKKRELIKEFSADKRVLYYKATDCSNEMQREYMAETIKRVCDVSFLQNDYATLFNKVRSGDGSKLVFIIDNFEILIKKDPSFMAYLLRLKYKKYYPGPIMIVLLSDSVMFCENDLKDVIKDDYNKINATIKVNEYNFLDVVRKFPDFTVSQSVEVYGILGGVPEYLEKWNKNKTVKQNVCDLILDKDGALRNEAYSFVSNELRECGVYNTIIASIAAGKEKLNDIYNYTGYSRPKISVYMKNLGEFDVIKKIISFQTGGWDNTKKGIYRIDNTLLNFVYRFVFPHESLLYVMTPEEFYDTYIKDELEDYLGRTFIKVCMEFLELSSSINKLPLKIEKMGTWVGKKGNIDIIAQDMVRHTLVGMCSWAEDCFTYEMYESLLNRVKEAKVKADYCFLFSAKGFEKKIIERAETDKTVIIVNMNEL